MAGGYRRQSILYGSNPYAAPMEFDLIENAPKEYPMSNGGEPPSTGSSSTPFLIGKDSRGNWVVQDPNGLHGGLFTDRVHALKYALSANGNRPRAVIMVPDVLELDFSARLRRAQCNRRVSDACDGLTRRIG
jgi:hypothetical protein